MSKVIDVQTDLPSADELKDRLGLGLGGRVQVAIDNAVLRWDEKYLPWKTGNLAALARGATKPGEGEVIYPGPYARYMYQGMIRRFNIPIFEDNSGDPTRWISVIPPGASGKVLTEDPIEYDTSMNSLAGPRWFERMKADHLQDIIQEAQNAADGKQ